MNEDRFWAIIDLLDWSKIGDDHAVLLPAVTELANCSKEDICHFDDILAEKLFAIDGERYARNVGEYSYDDENKYFSADLFLYIRCSAITSGKDAYQAILEDPTRMPKDTEFESLLYLAAAAYAKKTGDEFDYVTKHNYETFSNEDGWT